MDLNKRTMECLRGRRGLETSDDSFDNDILEMSPRKIVREVVAWELGDGAWADRVAELMVQAGATPDDFQI